jgi:hypothetical protein
MPGGFAATDAPVGIVGPDRGGPVRIGIVGLGDFGRLHALTAAGLVEADLVALVDGRQAVLDGLPAELAHVPRWSDLDVALAASRAEAWIVAADGAASDAIPSSPPPPPVMFEHLPDRLHAYVWRNWDLVPTATIARVVGATEEQIETLAASLGLPPNRPVPDHLQRQVYITVVRRNWHLLPVEQLLDLIGMTPAEFAFHLREESRPASTPSRTSGGRPSSRRCKRCMATVAWIPSRPSAGSRSPRTRSSWAS